MNIETLVRRLQDEHVRGVANERQIADNWHVKIYDDIKQDIIELQLIRRSWCCSDIILLRCPSWWRCDYVAEIFEKAINLWDNGNERDAL